MRHQGADSGTGSRPPDGICPVTIFGPKWPEIRISCGFFTRPGLVFSYPIRFHCTPLVSPLIPLSLTHAIVAFFPADPERESERGGDRLPSLDAPPGHDAAGGAPPLFLGSAGVSGAQQAPAQQPRRAQ